MMIKGVCRLLDVARGDARYVRYFPGRWLLMDGDGDDMMCFRKEV